MSLRPSFGIMRSVASDGTIIDTPVFAGYVDDPDYETPVEWALRRAHETRSAEEEVEHLKTALAACLRSMKSTADLLDQMAAVGNVVPIEDLTQLVELVRHYREKLIPEYTAEFHLVFREDSSGNNSPNSPELEEKEGRE